MNSQLFMKSYTRRDYQDIIIVHFICVIRDKRWNTRNFCKAMIFVFIRGYFSKVFSQIHVSLPDAWVKKLEEYKDWFAEQENLKANETLRPGKPTNYDELFGIDGSFRQLVID